MRSKTGRTLIAVLAVVGVVVLTLVLVTRGGAVTVQMAPNGSVLTVAANTNVVRALPLNTPVSINISETGGGSSGTASIVACSDGVAWSWVGLNGTGTNRLTTGSGVVAANTIMALATATGHRVLTVSPGAGTIRILAVTTPTRVYIHY